jgi:transposase
MKNYDEAVGIDVSKNTLDVRCYLAMKHKVFSNDIRGCKSMLKWVSQQTGKGSVFYCFENTGNCSLKLSTYLTSQHIVYVEESPIKIKRSCGLVREKSDKVDSEIIARYAWLHREELEPSELKGLFYQELGRLIGLRDQLVRNRAGLIGTLKESRQLLGSPSTDTVCLVLTRSIDYLSKQVKNIECRMVALVKEYREVHKSYELLRTMHGIGFVVALQLIYHTHNFRRFSTWRQFSSYCGLAPFEYSSGTSIHRRKKCHYLGDRKMKSLLSMASISAIQHDPELRKYYQKKVAQGKPKMIALNNVRNKLLSRAFAVIRRGTPYVALNQFAA